MPEARPSVGVLGGTGPLGGGLAQRLARAGYHVTVGSRDAARGQEAAEELSREAGVSTLRGGGNADAAGADVVIVAVPFGGLRATVGEVADALDGKVVVCAVNHLGFDGGPHAVDVEEGSSAALVAALAPGARVTAAFNTVAAKELGALHEPVHGDVPVVGDDDEARRITCALADAIEGLRGVDAGPLAHAHTLEALCALLISVNTRHRTTAGIAVTGL